MATMGKLIVVIGVVLVVFGAGLWLLGRLGFRGLPGDIVYESDNVRLYFPVATCLVLSAVATLLFWLWQWWMR
ncbi:MAG: DUF2905 domain-containing protein [Phycisphaeraceae bacterium]